MRYVNIRQRDQEVSFAEAVVMGLGKGRGLFFPRQLPPLENVPRLLEMDFAARSAHILQHLSGDAAAAGQVAAAFDFPLPLVEVADRVHALELFHGPSLAFKDFGARFMAGCLAAFNRGKNATILTATSGDTGAAVAHAFHGQPGIQVVVLYPRGKISTLQEKLFCTLGGNVRTLAVEGDFDACQGLVKQSFEDPELVAALGLNSANSINVARLLAQVCYYFEAAAQLPPGTEAVFSVPSGNFGNVTAALMACAIGLPARRVLAATNVNDTVPRYFRSGHWEPKPTIATLTNAMDISQPNNFPRVLEMEQHHGLDLGRLLRSFAIDDGETRLAVRALDRQGYLADPHSALAWRGLTAELDAGETGVFLCTAHPAKFADVMEDVLGRPVALPEALAQAAEKEVLSRVIPADYDLLRGILLES